MMSKEQKACHQKKTYNKIIACFELLMPFLSKFLFRFLQRNERSSGVDIFSIINQNAKRNFDT
jgi:hypothetical protein